HLQPGCSPNRRLRHRQLASVQEHRPRRRPDGPLRRRIFALPVGPGAAALPPFRSTQSQPLYPPSPPAQGAPTLTGSISTIDLDPSPVSVTIDPTSEPTDPTTPASANFVFTANDAISTVRCQLDGGPFGLCTTPTSQSYT